MGRAVDSNARPTQQIITEAIIRRSSSFGQPLTESFEYAGAGRKHPTFEPGNPMRLFASNGDELPVINTMCDATPESCRWGCGNQCAHPAPNTTESETFETVLRRHVSRRRLLTGAAAAAGMLVIGTSPLSRVLAADGDLLEEAAATGGLSFTPISLSTADRVEVAPGYTSRVLIRWGDPLFHYSAPWDPAKNTGADAATQFGYNCDYIGYLPRTEKSGLLIVNHDCLLYTSPSPRD